MNRRGHARSVAVALTVGLLFAALSALLAPEVWSALVQLKNDDNTAVGYTTTWQARVDGAELQGLLYSPGYAVHGWFGPANVRQELERMRNE